MKTIASYALQLVSNEVHDKIPIVCAEIIRSDNFFNPLLHMLLSRSVFLIDHLKIGKRKYNELRRFCKTEISYFLLTTIFWNTVHKLFSVMNENSYKVLLMKIILGLPSLKQCYYSTQFHVSVNHL